MLVGRSAQVQADLLGAVHLADGSILSQLIGILLNGCDGRQLICDSKSCSPLGKPRSQCPVFTSIDSQIRQSLCRCFTWRCIQRRQPLSRSNENYQEFWHTLVAIGSGDLISLHMASSDPPRQL